MQVRFGVQGSVCHFHWACIAWRTGSCAWSNGRRGTGSVLHVSARARGHRGAFSIFSIRAAVGDPRTRRRRTSEFRRTRPAQMGRLYHDRMPSPSSQYSTWRSGNVVLGAMHAKLTQAGTRSRSARGRPLIGAVAVVGNGCLPASDCQRLHAPDGRRGAAQLTVQF